MQTNGKIVVGNWKMNFLLTDVKDFLQSCLSCFSRHPSRITIGLAVPYVYLPEVEKLLHSENSFTNVYAGAQDCSVFYPSGPYTGEVSALMLASLNAGFVIIGHSERRKFFSESHPMLKNKITNALQAGLHVIYCIGETADERTQNLHFQTIEKQLEEVLSGMRFPSGALTIAYEPVWAIGTGIHASARQAAEMHTFIKEKLKTLNISVKSDDIPVIYGGSCTPENASELFSTPGVDGGLIGGASLKADSFCKILKTMASLL